MCQSAELAEHGQHGLQAAGAWAGAAGQPMRQAEPEDPQLAYFQGTRWMRVRAVLSQGVSITSSQSCSGQQRRRSLC